MFIVQEGIVPFFVRVCALVYSPVSGCPIQSSFSVILSTQDASAGAELYILAAEMSSQTFSLCSFWF